VDPANISIVTMTLSRTAGEERVLRDALQRLAAVGLNVAVADGGSPASFVDFLATEPRFTVVRPAARGLLAQVKAALETAAAWRTPYILYTEPDKAEFFSNHLMSFVRDSVSDGETAVAIAARSRAAFETYPPFQQYCESVINRLCKECIGVAGDYTYGPFVMRREFADVLTPLARDLGWGWRPYLFCAAQRHGGAVRHVTRDFPGPDEADGEDTVRMYRIRQLNQNVDGLLAAVAAADAVDREWHRSTAGHS
jgi:hypothetical protein